jgi:hypothetical protein
LKINNPKPGVVATGFTKFGKDVEASLDKVRADAKKGWGPGTGVAVAKDLSDSFKNLGAETVGVAETLGLRYPVSAYESKVDAGLTRGSRIDDPQGYTKLAQQGFKGIVDLTLEGTNDAKGAPAAGLNALNVKILDNSAPTTAQMKHFLDFATNPKNSPCYVHCEAGKGRTGVATACYRMAVDGFTPEQAISEGKKFGLALPNQIAFLQQFGADLAAGKIEGYPKK